MPVIARCGIIDLQWRRWTCLGEHRHSLAGEEGSIIAISKAQQKAVQKYVKEKYDRVVLTMPKGKKEDVKTAASAAGESMNQYIITAIDQRMERET